MCGHTPWKNQKIWPGKKKAEDYGIEFIELDDNVKKQLKDRAKGTIDLVSSDVDKEVIDSLFASLKEVN